MGSGYRRAIIGVVVVGFVAVVGIIGAALLLRAGSSTDPDAADGGDVITPMTAPAPGPGDPEPIPADRVSVVASSFLAPDQGITYEPDNTIDDDVDTAWNSDNAATEGRGQTLTYRFTEPMTITSIHFVNGYAKNEGVFDANHRIRDVIVHTDTGSQLVTLLDTAQRQEIDFDFGYTSKVTLEVADVYPGAGFADPSLTADLALTEVQFLATP